jgi:Spy/CpxP family protein refolding chaperone
VVYVSVFGILCVLVGVLVGATIIRSINLRWFGPERFDFAQRAEHFMGPGLREPGRKGGGGLIEMLAVKLDLSTEQKTKVAEILENTRKEIDSVGKNIRNAIIEIKENGDKQIMGILTPQQQEEFKALQNEFEERCGPGRQQGGERGRMRGRGFPPAEELPFP